MSQVGSEGADAIFYSISLQLALHDGRGDNLVCDAGLGDRSIGQGARGFQVRNRLK